MWRDAPQSAKEAELSTQTAALVVTEGAAHRRGSSFG